MKGALVVMPDGRYEPKELATDGQQDIVCAYAVFSGAHTGEGGPVPPTGKSMSSDRLDIAGYVRSTIPAQNTRA
jgi:hypothetical protein